MLNFLGRVQLLFKVFYPVLDNLSQKDEWHYGNGKAPVQEGGNEKVCTKHVRAMWPRIGMVIALLLVVIVIQSLFK
jgi:hypothetical protein